MFNIVRYGLVILSLLFPLITHADLCKSTYSSQAVARPCDVAFIGIPAFTATMCIGTVQSGIYTIQNNTPATLAINYIRVQANDALPAAATAIVDAPTSNCGTTLAPGAACNIQLNLQPLALGVLNRVLQVGINTRQVQISAPAVITVVNCTPLPPSVPPVPTPGPFVPPVPPPSLFSATILGASTVTNTGFTVVNGDVDVSPGTAITGFPPGTVVNGTLRSNDAVAQAAHADALTHYNNLVALPCPPGNNLTGINLGGLVLTPGVYCFNTSAFLTGTLTLVGGPASSFTFQIGSTLVTASNSNVVLSGGVSNGNVNWAVGSSATLGTFSEFQGIIDAVASITLTNGVSLLGRAWALNGAVTLDSNVVNPG